MASTEFGNLILCALNYKLQHYTANRDFYAMNWLFCKQTALNAVQEQQASGLMHCHRDSWASPARPFCSQPTLAEYTYAAPARGLSRPILRRVRRKPPDGAAQDACQQTDR